MTRAKRLESGDHAKSSTPPLISMARSASPPARAGAGLGRLHAHLCGRKGKQRLAVRNLAWVTSLIRPEGGCAVLGAVPACQPQISGALVLTKSTVPNVWATKLPSCESCGSPRAYRRVTSSGCSGRNSSARTSWPKIDQNSTLYPADRLYRCQIVAYVPVAGANKSNVTAANSSSPQDGCQSRSPSLGTAVLSACR